MAQQSILGRIAQMARANINALLDAAEDPEKMLDQMIRDYINNISDAEEAVAQTIGNLRMMEEDSREAGKAAADWGAKAAAAAGKAKELRLPPIRPRPSASRTWPESLSSARSPSRSRSATWLRPSPSRPTWSAS